YYQADSEVIFPPFDIHYWNKLKSNLSSYNFKDKFYNLSKKYYLIVSRMEPYKRIDLVINAFNQQSDKQLVIVGDGSKKTNLKKIAKANVVFLEGITDEHLAMLYSNAQALIMPQEEEFGYVALEAQLFLCPVLAYKKGGALETIIEGNSGLFFASQSVEDLVGTIAKFEKLSYTLKHYLKENGGKHLEKFNKKIFKDKILKIVQDK
ncbi:MAG TPA: glycosyltransferase, partial [Candidatus Nitrosocosmicus sp.]|nr:glycosyltransferase [Candidatus Nitrosocosmicus sp.]